MSADSYLLEALTLNRTREKIASTVLGVSLPSTRPESWQNLENRAVSISTSLWLFIPVFFDKPSVAKAA